MVQIKVRIMGINAPEVKGISRPEGLLARDYLRNMILSKDVIMKCYGLDKYGRQLAQVFYENKDISEDMISNGYAISYMPIK